MSFSTWAIAVNPPPASRQVRKLVMALWFLPIIVPGAIMAAARYDAGAHASAAFPAQQAPAIAQVRFQPPLPESFIKASQGKLNELQAHDARIMSDRLRLVLFNTQQTAASGPIAQKSNIKVAQAPDVVFPVRAQNANSASPSPRTRFAGDHMAFAGDETSALEEPRAKTNGQVLVFARAAANGPNRIQSGAHIIELADIAPPPAGASCKRIDGVIQPCAERAEHRLAILVQARTVRCTLTRQIDTNVHAGRCKADGIDIAADLLRQGLARRATASRSSGVL